MAQKKGPIAANDETLNGIAKHYCSGQAYYAIPGDATDSATVAAVAAALALEELHRLKALEHLPTPQALLERLQARSGDFNLTVGVVRAYLKVQVQPHISTTATTGSTRRGDQ